MAILDFYKYTRSRNYKITNALNGKMVGYIVGVNQPQDEVFEFKQTTASTGYHELLEIVEFLKRVNSIY